MIEPIDGSTRGLTPPKPWERQPREGAKAFQGFCVYRDLGPRRTAEEAARRLGRSLGNVTKWCHHWSWVCRAASWDDEAASRAARGKLEQEEESARLEVTMHAAARRRAWAAAVLALEKALEAIRDGSYKPKARDCFALTESALRLSERGQAGQDVELEKLRAKPLPDLAQELVDTVREQFGIDVRPREPKVAEAKVPS